MQFVGKIIFIGEKEKVGSNQTDKVTFVLEETNVQYPNSVALDLMGDKVSMIDNLKLGDVVEASFNIKCNQYNGKQYNSLRARKIVKKDEISSSHVENNNDLPF